MGSMRILLNPYLFLAFLFCELNVSKLYLTSYVLTYACSVGDAPSSENSRLCLVFGSCLSLFNEKVEDIVLVLSKFLDAIMEFLSLSLMRLCKWLFRQPSSKSKAVSA